MDLWRLGKKYFLYDLKKFSHKLFQKLGSENFTRWLWLERARAHSLASSPSASAKSSNKLDSNFFGLQQVECPQSL